jgi:hypothetical protein
VAIGSSLGKCNDSACAANASTSGAYTLICSGSFPSSVGSVLSPSLVLEGGAGVRDLAIPTVGDCIAALCCRRASSAICCSSVRLCSTIVGSWSSSGPCWSSGCLSLLGMLQFKLSLAGCTVIQ